MRPLVVWQKSEKGDFGGQKWPENFWSQNGSKVFKNLFERTQTTFFLIFWALWALLKISKNRISWANNTEQSAPTSLCKCDVTVRAPIGACEVRKSSRGANLGWNPKFAPRTTKDPLFIICFVGAVEVGVRGHCSVPKIWKNVLSMPIATKWKNHGIFSVGWLWLWRLFNWSV